MDLEAFHISLLLFSSFLLLGYLTISLTISPFYYSTSPLQICRDVKNQDLPPNVPRLTNR